MLSAPRTRPYGDIVHLAGIVALVVVGVLLVVGALDVRQGLGLISFALAATLW